MMEMLKNGTEVIVNRCCNVVNMLTGNPVDIEKDTIATVIGVNDGAIYGYVRYMIDIPYDCLDEESDGHVKCWVLAEWVREAMLHDRYGHNVCWVNGKQAAEIVANAFIRDEVRTICVSDDTFNPDDPTDLDAANEWYGIKKIDKLPFDNNKEEMLLMMGAYGGGLICTSYYCGRDEYYEEFLAQIRDMMSLVTDNHPDNNYLLQLIEKNYVGDEGSEL